MKKLLYATGYLILIVSSGLVKATDTVVRNYNPIKDYDSVMALCGKAWRELAEIDEECTGSFDTILQATLAYKNLGIPKIVDALAKVIEADKKIVGFGYASIFPNNADPILPPDEGLAELSYFFFDPAYRGKGYSLLLFNALKQALLKQGVTTLITRIPNANEEALSWHQMQGFRPIYAGGSETPLEEKERIAANSEDFALLRLRLGERVKQDSAPYKWYFERIKQSVDPNKKIKDILQLRLAQKLADLAQVSFPLLPPAARLRIARWFLRHYDNQELVLNSALYILKKSKRDTAMVKIIRKYLDFLNKNFNSLTETIYQEEPEILNKIYHEEFL